MTRGTRFFMGQPSEELAKDSERMQALREEGGRHLGAHGLSRGGKGDGDSIHHE